MKIIVLNSADVNIEVLNVPDRMIENDDIEQFLSEHGYSLNNTLWACGLNSTGQLGDGTTTNRRTPKK